ncbi:hypothetical protein CR513_42165, partial [Mucuna pruriens]
MIAQPECDLSRDINTLGFIPICGRCSKKVLTFGGQRRETGYGIRKLHPVHAGTHDLYYNPPLKCFTFRDFQLVPTLEEYERILGMPLERSSPYLFKG